MTFRFFQAAAAALLFCAALAGPAGAAAAQRTQLADPPNEPADIRALHEFSRCAAQRWEGRARAILAMDYRTDDYRNRIRRFAQDQWRCFPRGMLRFGQMLFAGGMAEALLPGRLAGADLAARVAHDPARPPLQARDQSEMMSLCTVRAASAEVAALLRTQAASEPETAALRGLIPQMSRCLGAGQAVRVNRVGMRSVLALAAYRLAEHGGAVRTASAGRPALDGTTR
ncbi:MAG TPA: hypothetical protein VEW71_07170 [Allosphingosinicella sp.]|nr:hypothetical protein [Allosphingosinicella sp.]